jgi:hypothetical protein
VAVWNEPDAGLRGRPSPSCGRRTASSCCSRRRRCARLPPGSGRTPTLEARGHDALEVRVTRAYEEFIAPGEFTSRQRDNADRLDNLVKFNWEMVPSGGGEPAGVGLEILVFDDDGRIRIDYQFIER